MPATPLHGIPYSYKTDAADHVSVALEGESFRDNEDGQGRSFQIRGVGANQFVTRGDDDVFFANSRTGIL